MVKNRIKHILNENKYLLNNARSLLAAAAAADAYCIDTLRPFSDSIICSFKDVFDAIRTRGRINAVGCSTVFM